jgi:hypothetical protein
MPWYAQEVPWEALYASEIAGDRIGALAVIFGSHTTP